MHTDLTPCFTADELPLATRLLATRATRLGVEPGLLLRAAIRDLVFDEAGRPAELTVSVVESAETRADAAQLVRDNEAARLEAETVALPTTNQEITQ